MTESDPNPRGLGGTVDGVLLTVVTGALRRYSQERGDPVDRKG